MAKGLAQSRDWESLKREFLAGNETPNAFFVRKKLGNSKYFYGRVRAMKWVERRREIQERATEKAANAIVDGKVEEFERQLKLFNAIENHVAHLLKRHVSPEGKIISNIDPQELKALAEIVSKSVATRKHIKGDPPPGGEGGGHTSIHLHQTLVQVVTENEKDGSGPTLLIPPDTNRKRGE